MATIAQRYDELPMTTPMSENPVPASAMSPASAKAVDRISGGATTAVMARRPGATKAKTIMAVQMHSAASHRVGATPRTDSATAATTPAQQMMRNASLGLSSNR